MTEEQEQELLEKTEDLLGIRTISIYDLESFAEENNLNSDELITFVENKNIILTD